MSTNPARLRPQEQRHDATALASSTQEDGQPPPLLLDRVGVAAALGVSIRAVDKLRARGALPAPVRLGRSVRWSRTELGAWVAAGCPAANLWERLGRGNGEQS